MPSRNSEMPSRAVQQPTLLNFYVSAFAVGAAGALALAGWEQVWRTDSLFVNGLVALFAVGLVAELSSVRLHVGSSTLSIAFVPFLAAAFLFGPFWAMAVGGLTQLIVESAFRKKPWLKVVFNTSKETLALGLAGSVYLFLGGEPSVEAFHFRPIAIVAASFVYSAINALTVSFAISLSEQLRFREAWTRVHGSSVLYDLLTTPLPALLAFAYAEAQLLGLLLVSGPLFIVRHIFAVSLQLEQANRDLLELMVKQIEARDPYTSGHSQRVREYARIVAKEAGLSARHVEQVATAALLHDVGKVYNEYAPLLLKDGRLTPEEKLLLQSHPIRSAELVATISSLRGTVEKAVRHHHECFDGTGYPDGVAGEDIPIGARIIMLADTLDAMTTDRPYRKALPFERAVEEIRKYSGKQFDPLLAELLVTSQAIRRMVQEASPQASVPPSIRTRPPSWATQRAAI